MAEFRNSDKLAAVVSKWARPAISQIAASRIMQFPAMRSLQYTIANSGLVGKDYILSNDIEPLVQPVVDAVVQPMIKNYLTGIPEESIPAMARGIVEQWKSKGQVSLLDGLVTLDAADIEELDKMLCDNLPVTEEETYQVI